MKRRIFMWVGLIVLFLSFGFCPEALAAKIYKVKKGDYIAAIAKKRGIDLQALKKANSLVVGNKLRIGQELVIPEKEKQDTAKSEKKFSQSTCYTVKRGDTLSKISRKAGVSVSEIKKTNNLHGNFLKTGRKILLAKAVVENVKKEQPAVVPVEVSEDEEEFSLKSGLIDISQAETGKDVQSDTALLGKWNNLEERKLFVKVATAFLGAPYRWGGASIKGIDCSAFVKKMYQLFDVSLPRTAKEQACVGMRVDRNELIEGDLVFFNTKRLFGHVGIYIGNNEFVHASSREKGVSIDNLRQPYYDKHFVRAVRLKGLDEEVL